MKKSYGVFLGAILVSLASFGAPNEVSVLDCSDTSNETSVKVTELTISQQFFMKINDNPEIAVERRRIETEGGPTIYKAIVGVEERRATLTITPSATPTDGKIPGNISFYERVGTGVGGNSPADVLKSVDLLCKVN